MSRPTPSTAEASPLPLAVLTAGMLEVPADVLVTDLTLDSRAVTPGALFLARRGGTRHGAEFIDQALAAGARAVLYEASGIESSAERARDTGQGGAFIAGVPDLTQHLGRIADRFFGAPSLALTIAGVTGTNGKTTCAFLLAQALGACGRPAGYMGTLGYGLPGALTPAALTTTDVVSVHRQLAQFRAMGAECVAMEVSSHALEQGRVDAVRFHAAAFTNLTRDHLDYHGSMEAYAAAKARLFERGELAGRVINIDDAFGRELAAGAGAGELIVTTRRAADADTDSAIRTARCLRAAHVQASPEGLELEVELDRRSVRFGVPLIGDFNVDNILTVLGVLATFGVPLEQAAHALERCTAPPGRMEVIADPRTHVLVIVDYAHTPDALAKALEAARAHCRGRLRVVFGCGGDRDRGKRPLMGRVAAGLADEIILTDDNPRTEDPVRIVEEIRAGIDAKAALEVEHDRAAAIRLGIVRSRTGDALLIAGKGHEDYQITASGRRDFSDQRAAREALGAVQRGFA